ncbi:MAG TPA: TylF/MycF/NovP-related O-methyltransferase [Acidobacteriaceae bacterium]|jgi:O-methyltransferase|nr:TylF/MycF/NovP-related O-methyltransferase [Acidobacteriaceae bacterium]
MSGNVLKVVKGNMRVAARKAARLVSARQPMLFPTYPKTIADYIERYHDDIRYASVALAVQCLLQEGINGAFAELGVYQGTTSAFLHRLAPERRLYLFDTFVGFPMEALEGRRDGRFRDTSQEAVAANIGDSRNIEFRKGYFPATSVGMEGERFAFVMLDFDLYRPALDAFTFFYPRLVRGGYFFLHDFNSPESDRAISRAAREFLADKPELLVEIPDRYGSAVFRKVREADV